MKDRYNDVKISKVIAPVSPSATGTVSGTAIDTANFANLTFVIAAGAQTTTSITVTPIVKDGTATGSLTSAAAADILGTEAGAALDGTAGASSVSKVGYTGTSRYVTCDLVVANAATGVYSVTAVQSGARKKPQS